MVDLQIEAHRNVEALVHQALQHEAGERFVAEQRLFGQPELANLVVEGRVGSRRLADQELRVVVEKELMKMVRADHDEEIRLGGHPRWPGTPTHRSFVEAAAIRRMTVKEGPAMNDDERASVANYCARLFPTCGTIKDTMSRLQAMKREDSRAAFPNTPDNSLPAYKAYATEYIRGDLRNLGIRNLRELGVDLVDVASDKQATPGFRALDAIARVLQCAFPNEVCVAVCIEPR